MTPPFLGHSEHASVLEGLTPTAVGDRHETGTAGAAPSTWTWTSTQRRAALVLAEHARDPGDLVHLPDVCGLLPVTDADAPVA